MRREPRRSITGDPPGSRHEDTLGLHADVGTGVPADRRQVFELVFDAIFEGVGLYRLVQSRREWAGVMPLQPAALRFFRIPQHPAKLRQGRDVLFSGQRIGEKTASDRDGVAGPPERPPSGGVGRQNVSNAGRLAVQGSLFGSIA